MRRTPSCRSYGPSLEPAGIDVKTSDISVAARILAEFADYLTEEQRVPDNLAELGGLTQDPETNIIKLPNISASVPQLVAAIKELKAKGYDLPDYPDDPKTDEDKEIRGALRQVPGQCGESGSARKATRTVAPPRRSRSTPASTRTAWVSGRRRPAPTWRP